MHDYHGHYGGMHFIWWIIWMAVIIFIVIIPRFNTFPKNEEKKETPLTILKRRYAKGEITKEEFQEAKEIVLQDNKS